MHFLYPTFLWALGALAIPIIIHLFHFRRFKKVYFTNVHLLKELKEETSTRSRLRNIVILLTRLLALALLVLAFAQPILSDTAKQQKKNHVVTVILDNSFSMNALKSEVPLLTRAKDQAETIVQSYGETDQYLLITPDLSTKHLRLVDQKTVLDFIQELRSTASVTSLEELTSVAHRIIPRDEQIQKEIYILSDFQQNISSYKETIDSSYSVNLLPLRAVQENNVAIVSARFDAPVPMINVVNKLLVDIQNFSNSEQAVQLSMNYQGQNRPQGVAQIAPNSSVTDTINILLDRAGWHKVELRIEDYPVTFDDQLFVAFNIKPDYNILSIYDQRINTYVDKAFSASDNYSIQQQSLAQLKYDQFSRQDLIILDDLRSIGSGLNAELIKYVNDGGNLLVFPSASGDITEFNRLLSGLGADRLASLDTEEKQVSRINMDEFIFNDVFESRRRNMRLPLVKSHYRVTNNPRAIKESILTYRDGSDYLTKYNHGKGQLFLCVAPLDVEANELVTNAEIFIPLLYKMAISTSSQESLYYTISDNEIIPVANIGNAGQGNYVVTGPSEFIPNIIANNNQSIIDVRDQVSSSGFYNLDLEERTIMPIAFNYSRTESDMTYSDMNQVRVDMGDHVKIVGDTAMASLSSYINTKNSGVQLWRWCLILALVFLLIETILLRTWKQS